mmetsp:Transcript_24084/g.48296  ORF Transcript_24084/g.48296 Transcript_24084/m.48296 type:complete len:327 (-) Transcript_24084:235-1215(-)
MLRSNAQRSSAHRDCRTRRTGSANCLCSCDSVTDATSSSSLASARRHSSTSSGSLRGPTPAMGSVSQSLGTSVCRMECVTIIVDLGGSAALPCIITDTARSRPVQSASARPLAGHGLEVPMAASLGKSLALPGDLGPRYRCSSSPSSSFSIITCTTRAWEAARASTSMPKCDMCRQWCETVGTACSMASTSPVSTFSSSCVGSSARRRTAVTMSSVKQARASSTGHVTTPPSSHDGSASGPSSGLSAISTNAADVCTLAPTSRFSVDSQSGFPTDVAGVRRGRVSEWRTDLYQTTRAMSRTSSGTGRWARSSSATKSSTNPLKPSS